ncbi:hypothetical protein BN59_03388 [Legionella massiliensis]|uniref:Uncharacterized protein n=1 Tax=Legionella massiliensis TaxID=1034943 RepID=A0A078L1F6_9GAMM|nr:hypothetical protein [Legionella massiliensis]CDZ79072.1 hypothetical protein BN59_03388 [Legionella massiliensis]CEE14810.1 hypothetical protein BN1094_03388 [Legionella massiliensis]
MKKILILVVIVTATSLATGCANCGYSSCTVCSGSYSTTSCCGSNGWY